jgi:hypothetical protein
VIDRGVRALLAAGLAIAAAGAAFPIPGASAQSWRLEQPPPPPGAPFTVPLGTPGDLQFWARNRGLLAVEGNATIPRGLFFYDGVRWRQLSTVCGGPGDTTRIAWAGPREFWTVTQPSPPRAGSGTALCHFRDGQVVASYSTPEEAQDPFRQMFAAACNGPSNCWFGGVGSQDPIGERVGAFHLHWDGVGLTTSYNPQGRGVSDLEAHGGSIYESVLVGPRPESPEAADLAEPETPAPRLIHALAGGVFANEDFVPSARPDVPAQGTELLALDSDGGQLWAVGGGAASGPAVPTLGTPPSPDPPVRRPPLAARLEPGGWRELTLTPDVFGDTERFADVAALPGTDSAWVAVQPFSERRSTNVKAKVALIRADGTATVVRLPLAGSGRGSAARIACTAPADCWLVTQAGWLFHYTDGASLPRDDDPAFAGVITFRPNESAEQFVPDRPPLDDSQLFAPPPLEVQQEAAPQPRTRRLPPLIRRIRSRVRKLTLTVSFTLVRRARVALIARRRGRVGARTRPKMLPRGRHAFHLRLNRRRWPTRLAFSVREPGQHGGGGSGDGNTIVTPGRAG